MKTALNSTLLLLGAVFAHAISCGTFIPILPFVSISACVLAVLRALNAKELEGPKLALVILFVQSAAHFGLGGMSMNTSKMLLSHFAVGAISYFLMKAYERFWNFSGYVLTSLIGHFTFIPSSFPLVSTKVNCAFPEYLNNLNGFLRSATNRIPAPPNFVAALDLSVSIGG